MFHVVSEVGRIPFNTHRGDEIIHTWEDQTCLPSFLLSLFDHWFAGFLALFVRSFLPSFVPSFLHSFPKQFTVGVLNATLDLAALVLVGVVGFLGSEVVLSPVVSHCLRLSPFMWGVGVGWCGRLLGL